MNGRTGRRQGVQAALSAALLGTALAAWACGFAPTTPTGGADGGVVVPAPANLTVTGMVTGDGVPIVNAIVEVRSHEHMWRVTTDASGRYQASVSEPGALTLWVTANELGRTWLQPCGVWFERSSTDPAERVADVSLYSAAGLPNASVASVAGRRRISGTVYVRSGAGREPMAEASVAWDRSDSDEKAWTQTDAAGRFTLCALPTGALQVVAYEGIFHVSSVVAPGGDADIELTLEPLE
jgi:hypothetical protein